MMLIIEYVMIALLALSNISASNVDKLKNLCLDWRGNDWWSYKYCYKTYILQYHDDDTKTFVGNYSPQESTSTHQVYRSLNTDCWSEMDQKLVNRYAEVELDCCNNSRILQNESHFIKSIEEPISCSYYLKVCTDFLCSKPTTELQVNDESEFYNQHNQLSMLDKIRAMFSHAYDGYMRHAFPEVCFVYVFSLKTHRLRIG